MIKRFGVVPQQRRDSWFSLIAAALTRAFSRCLLVLILDH